MADPLHHSISSVKKWGGVAEDYYDIHQWFDESKWHFGDFRHRALRHHTQGIAECVEKFGPSVEITTSVGFRLVPVRWVAEQHVREDIGHIPSLGDWLANIRPAEWMNKPRRLSKELEADSEGA